VSATNALLERDAERDDPLLTDDIWQPCYQHVKAPNQIEDRTSKQECGKVPRSATSRNYGHEHFYGHNRPWVLHKQFSVLSEERERTYCQQQTKTNVRKRICQETPNNAGRHRALTWRFAARRAAV